MAENLQELNIEIVSPSGYLFSGQCIMAVIPAAEGEMGFMANHETVLAGLQEGKIVLYDRDKKITNQFEIKGGFAKMIGNKLLILADG